jgi:ketosteroid isomerase-like protein
MNFMQTLDRHLQAIQNRGLAGLLETLPPDEITLIMSNGKLVRSVREFADLHRGWFEQRSWSLETKMVSLQETPDMGFAVLRLDYRDQLPDGKALHETSYLTLVFARKGDRWEMVLDQNTPLKE